MSSIHRIIQQSGPRDAGKSHCSTHLEDYLILRAAWTLSAKFKDELQFDVQILMEPTISLKGYRGVPRLFVAFRWLRHVSEVSPKAAEESDKF